MNHLNPARYRGEDFLAYKARRKAVNAAVKLHLRGELRHTAAHVTPALPLAGVDAAVDQAILGGKLRDVTLVTLKDGKQFRVGRTKGVTHYKGAA